MEKQKSLKKNTFFSFLNSFSKLFFPFITFPYASRILHAEGIGQVNFATNTVNIFSLIAGLGISSYATREAARLRDNRFELSKFCKEMFCINFVSMLIAYTLLFLSLLFIPKLQNYNVLILITSIYIFFSAIGFEWLYKAEEEFQYITIRSLIFKFLGLFFLFLFVRSEGDTIEYAIFGIFTSVTTDICNLFYTRKYIDLRIKVKLELKKHLKYIFTFFGMGLVTSLYTIFDTIMLGFLTTDVQIGYYTAATKFNKLTVGLLTSISAILLPRLAYYLSNNEDEKFYKLFEKSLSIIIMLAVPTTIGLIVLAKPLLLLFVGQEYEPAIIAMNTISPIIISISIASVTGTQVLPALNKEKVSLLSYIIGAVTNVTMNLIFIPKYGALGAAIGTLVAETSVTFTQIIFLRKLISIEILNNLIHSTISCIPMVGILFLIKYFISNNIIIVILSISLSVIIYLLFLVLLRNKYCIEYIHYFADKIKTKFRKENKSNEE